MKTKNFVFQQTVITQVTNRYDYKIKATNREEAEKKFKKVFNQKAEEGKEYLPFKKLKPKKASTSAELISPQILDSATVTIEIVEGKKKKAVAKELYNNKVNQWAEEVQSQSDKESVSENNDNQGVADETQKGKEDSNN